jgi:hypothetical protein
METYVYTVTEGTYTDEHGTRFKKGDTVERPRPSTAHNLALDPRTVRKAAQPDVSTTVNTGVQKPPQSRAEAEFHALTEQAAKAEKRQPTPTVRVDPKAAPIPAAKTSTGAEDADGSKG